MLCRIFLKCHANMKANGLKSPADTLYLVFIIFMYINYMYLYMYFNKLINIGAQAYSSVQFLPFNTTGQQLPANNNCRLQLSLHISRG